MRGTTLSGKSIREGLDHLKRFETQYPSAMTGETPFSLSVLKEYAEQLALFSLYGTHTAEIAPWIERGERLIRETQQFLEQSDRQIEKRDALLDLIRRSRMVETWKPAQR